MNDDNDTDFFFDLLQVLVAIFVFILFCTAVGGIVWGLIA